MLKVVRQKPENVDDETLVEFTVYRSPKDNSTVLGYMQHFYPSGPKEGTFVKSDYGMIVEDAFAYATKYAEERGIPYVWINDPEDLFIPDDT